MLREAKSVMGKRTKATKKKRQRETKKNPEETDVT
jgi:hypothetical protein